MAGYIGRWDETVVAGYGLGSLGAETLAAVAVVAVKGMLEEVAVDIEDTVDSVADMKAWAKRRFAAGAKQWGGRFPVDEQSMLEDCQ